MTTLRDTHQKNQKKKRGLLRDLGAGVYSACLIPTNNLNGTRGSKLYATQESVVHADPGENCNC